MRNRYKEKSVGRWSVWVIIVIVIVVVFYVIIFYALSHCGLNRLPCFLLHDVLKKLTSTNPTTNHLNAIKW